MDIKIVGMQFKSKEAKAMLKASPIGTPVILKREPDNAYDRNAIKVLLIKIDSDMFKDVGYVAKEQAKLISEEWPAVVPYLHGELIAKNTAKINGVLSKAELAAFANKYRITKSNECATSDKTTESLVTNSRPGTQIELIPSQAEKPKFKAPDWIK